jgi:RNA polymerase sigma factor (sigma-70 family)
MATTALGTVLQNLRRSLLRQDEAGLTDSELLERFITRRDEVAFAALARRHGPMVLGVCRRILRNEADAEDAFQATFLVLVRKAASIRPRGMVGNWLYGVAHSTALKARAMSTKRSAREREAAARPKQEATAETWEQLHSLLDEELKALPEKYRAAIVLCDLEGKSIKEAARQFACPPGTVGTRLARGRSLLARRLARHGLAVSGGLIATAIAQHTTAAVVPPLLLSRAVKAATLVAAGQAATTAVSAKVAALTEGALKTMFLTKLKIATAVLLVALAGLSAGGLYQTQAAETAKAQNQIERRTQNQANLEASSDQQLPTPRGGAGLTFRAFLEGNAFWTLTDVDTKNNTISVNWADRMSLAGLVVAADAKVLLDGKERRLADLKTGMWITPRMAAGKPLITMIVATSKEADLYVVNAVNTENSTITVRLGNFNVTLPVAKDAMIVIRNKESSLADLRTGMPISLKLEPVGDQMAATSIRAEQYER